MGRHCGHAVPVGGRRRKFATLTVICLNLLLVPIIGDVLTEGLGTNTGPRNDDLVPTVRHAVPAGQAGAAAGLAEQLAQLRDVEEAQPHTQAAGLRARPR